MTINEIAKMAGVSRATVSRYLNDGYVSEEKREQIRRVIEKTGYQPSASAQMLRSRKTKLVGVVLPKINSDAVSRMVAGISQVLSAKDYQMILANTDNDLEEELKYLTLFRERKVDGVIFIATMFTPRHRQLLKEYQVPVVILGQQLSGYPCVFQDDFNAARELAGVLAQEGREFGCLQVTEKDRSAGQHRKEGLEAGLAEKRRYLKPENIEEVGFSVEAGYEGMKALYRRNPEIDSVFCATDNIAVGAAAYLKDIGKQIPGEVQLAGVGDSLTGRVISPRLTTVHYFYKTSGTEVAQMLWEMMEEEKPVRREIKMGYEILIRESVRKRDSSE